MGKDNFVTKQDLEDFGVTLRREMRSEMAVLRIDLINEMKAMFDEVLIVLGDMMTHIDKRFNRLEPIVEQHGKAIKRLENSRY